MRADPPSAGRPGRAWPWYAAVVAGIVAVLGADLTGVLDVLGP